MTSAFGKLPMLFQANAGQTNEQVKFTAQGKGYSVFLTPTESVFVLSRANSRAVLRMQLADANSPSEIVGLGETQTKLNYFVGRNPSSWRKDVPSYSRVRLADVYPGVDMVYHGDQQQIEYDFVIAPGASWKQIALDFAEAKELEVDENGDLVLKTAIGTLRQHHPLAYQEIGGKRRNIESRYVKLGESRIGFEVASYDPSKTLVIDPTLSYSTYLGGTGAGQGDAIGGDTVSAITVDSDGNAYLVGGTDSPDFPVTPGAYLTNYSGSGLSYVTKLNSAGTAIVYSSFFSNCSLDAIAVDSSGNAYLTGSASDGFPTTAGAYQASYSSHGAYGSNAFVTKLSPDGSSLIYSTFIGGSGNDGFDGFTGGDVAGGIDIDPSGNAYIIGSTYSHDYPITPGAVQTMNKANNAVNPKTAFVTKLDASGASLGYSTYLGGTELENGIGIKVDALGNAYVTGSTASDDFPVTTGAYQTTYPGFRSAFITKFNPSGTALLYSTYMGGSAFAGTEGMAIAIDSAGAAYITGQTFSTNYPTTSGSFRDHYCGGYSDSFVTKLAPSGATLDYSSYLCAPDLSQNPETDDTDFGFGIAVDNNGLAYVTGYTNSKVFPVTSDAYQSTTAGYDDAFLTVFSADGASLVYSTVLGGTGFEGAYAGVALDGSGHAYIAGATSSNDFPVTSQAYQYNYAGGNDVFVSKFNFNTPVPGQLLNISTRVPVMGGDQIADGGFIITGTDSKKVIIRGIGPSLGGVTNALADPTLTLFQGNTQIAMNDNWRDTQEAEIIATTIPPSDDAESAIVANLAPGAYTAILAGKNGTSGVGLVEVYDLDQAANSKLANISTRGFVSTVDNVMIGGFIANNDGGSVIVRALGPSLTSQGVSGALADPTLELHNANGILIASNDNWQDTQQAEIEATTIPPTDPLESAIVKILSPGNYTAIVRGKNDTTGVALVEVYQLSN